MARTVARWESRSGKWFVELQTDDASAYFIVAPGSGGTLYPKSQSAAIAEVESRLAMGLYQPDSAKTPMKRVFVPDPWSDVTYRDQEAQFSA